MKIKAAMIIEMMGRPAEHIKKTMKQLIENLGKEEEVKIQSKKIHSAKKIEKQGIKQDLFSIFSDVEIECDLNRIFSIVSKYMPSHIEIIEPAEIRMSNYDLNILVGEYSRRLHRYDEIAKRALIQNQVLENQLKELRTPVNQEKPENKEKIRKRKK
jgi:hypothetical protein